jgi:hydrogenase maturation protease
MRLVTVLVCGEPLRGDDGVADAVIQHLPPATHSLLRIEHVGLLTPDHLLAADGPVILLDAVDGPPAGEIVDMPLSGLRAAADAGISPASSHGLPLPASIAIVERLGDAPVDGRFIGVAGADYRLGAPLSAAVHAAVPGCARRLNHWARVLAHGMRQRSCA